MELRAFAICRDCGDLYPSARMCPTCDGDRLAAYEMQLSMRGQPAVTERLAPLPPPKDTEPVATWKPVVAALSIGLALCAILAVAVQA